MARLTKEPSVHTGGSFAGNVGVDNGAVHLECLTFLEMPSASPIGMILAMLWKRTPLGTTTDPPFIQQL